MSLAHAREQARENQFLASKGVDPRTRGAGTPKFAEAAEKVISLHAPAWTAGGKSAGQWRSSLRTYAFPRLGEQAVDSITTADVMEALSPIWNTKRVTAQRVRQRIGVIMKWGIAEGYRSDNPAGEAIVAAMPQVGHRPSHHPAIPHEEVRDALAKVRSSRARPVTRLALEFLVLTAVRSGEVRFARWEEIDFDTATWTVPVEHTKDKRVHRIPLSARALEVLRAARGEHKRVGLVFASAREMALSDSAMSKLLHRLKIGAVPHGFRSSFRDWCGETAVAREVAEACLAHSLERQEAAYARSDLFGRRRVVMEKWSAYVTGESAGSIKAA